MNNNQYITITPPLDITIISKMLDEALDHNLRPVKWVLGTDMHEAILLHYAARTVAFPAEVKFTHLRNIPVEIDSKWSEKLELLCEKRAINEC